MGAVRQQQWFVRIALVSALALGALTAGCGGDDRTPHEEQERGSITISLSTSEAKTIWPAGWADSIGLYTVFLTTPGGAVLYTWGPGDPDTETIRFDDVPFGTYRVTVGGDCAQEAEFCSHAGGGVPIAAGTSDEIVLDGESASATVDVGPLIGPDHAGITGWIDLTVQWPAGQDVARVTRDHRPIDADEFQDAADFNTFDTAGGASSVQVVAGLVVDNGAHMVRTRWFDSNDALVATAMEVVNVYGNYRTVGTIVLTDDDFFEPITEPGDLRFVVQWGGEADRTFILVGSFNDWDIASAPALEFSAPRSSLTIPGVIDGPFDFHLCNDRDWDCWAWANGITWTLEGEPAAYTPVLDPGNPQQLTVDALPGDDVQVLISVDTATVRVTSPPEDPPVSPLTVDINVVDPAPATPLTLTCARAGDLVVCEHDGTFDPGVTFAWYLNGTLRSGETGPTFSRAASDLRAGHRVTLVVNDPPLAHSASFTLTDDVLAGIVWTYIVDFEGAGETKTTYTTGTVQLSGLDWDLTEVLIGTDTADFRNGLRSARFRGHGTSAMTMLDPKPNGLGSLSFLYRRYGTDAQAAWQVEATTDGTTWTPVGDPFTPPASDEVQTFQETANLAGDVRIRIRCLATGTVNRRMNVDDIRMSDFP